MANGEGARVGGRDHRKLTRSIDSSGYQTEPDECFDLVVVRMELREAGQKSRESCERKEIQLLSGKQ